MILRKRQKLPTTIGRYRTVRELGHGAMGRVLLAVDPVLDREVAVKYLRADLPLEPEQRKSLLTRMQQEARASARVSHPNLVALHDMGEDAEVGLFLVFEYVPGPTLKDRIARGKLEPEEAARIASQISNGLTRAHEAGVLHRDVKPDNVILSQSGAKIADFGIARVPDSTLTQGGNILGTPAYSAPEALRGNTFSDKSDQFSLAATLYEAISGRRAFPGDNAVSVASLIANEEPPSIAEFCELAPAVDTVLSRGLSKNPEARYPTAVVFGHALSDALVPASRARLATLPDSRHVASSRVRRTGFLLAAIVAAGVAALGVWFFSPKAEKGSPATTRAKSATTSLLDEEIPPIAWLHESPRQMNRRASPSKRPRKARPTKQPLRGKQKSARGNGSKAR